jgi:hypothetical protein
MTTSVGMARAALLLGAVLIGAPVAAQPWGPPPGAVVVAPPGAVPGGWAHGVRPPAVRVYPVAPGYRYRRGPSAGEVLAGVLVVGTVAAIAASASQPARSVAAAPRSPLPPQAPGAPAAPGARLSALAACAETAEASAGPGARTVSARETGFDRGIAWVEGEVADGPRSSLRFSCGFDGVRITAFRFV